jgi:hypothetical protein
MLVFATFLLVAGCLHAQSVSLRANIPFDFFVGDTMLPAGAYTIKPIGVRGDIVLLRNTTLEKAIFIVSCASAMDLKEHDSELVFQISNGRHTLWQIWTHDYQDGRELSVRPDESQETCTAGSSAAVTKVTAISIQP